MDKIKESWPLMLGAAGLAAAATYLATTSSKSDTTTKEKESTPAFGDDVFDNVLIGDVGGTNVRFQLIRMYHNDP